ncbi:UNVERIFIED_CONTAM: hypothetical protein Sangu_3179700 [Sesamum angustifolium]|uniref:RNase H type-1 domain-containing protein n=1 Tax=Sesamum angustifolium TaxID=2727405 RepID=A0AAW2JN46_9LAMI
MMFPPSSSLEKTETTGRILETIPLLIMWNIWNLRNEAKHKGVIFKETIVIRKTLAYLQNLHRCGLMKSEHAQGDLFAVNSFNIPLKPNPEAKSNYCPLEETTRRGHLRDHLRRVIFAFQEPLGTNTNTQAKLSAIHRGLEICRDKGFRNIWIETDAKAIITLISSPRQGAWNVQNTLQRIQKIVSQMKCRISHIFREGNQAADFLPNQACSAQQHCILHENGLTGNVKGIVTLDSSGLPYIRFKNL